jgi:hypothetical protein
MKNIQKIKNLWSVTLTVIAMAFVMCVSFRKPPNTHLTGITGQNITVVAADKQQKNVIVLETVRGMGEEGNDR